MVTRIISANASEILKMDGTQLKQSIKLVKVELF